MSGNAVFVTYVVGIVVTALVMAYLSGLNGNKEDTPYVVALFWPMVVALLVTLGPVVLLVEHVGRVGAEHGKRIAARAAERRRAYEEIDTFMRGEK